MASVKTKKINLYAVELSEEEAILLREMMEYLSTRMCFRSGSKMQLVDYFLDNLPEA